MVMKDAPVAGPGSDLRGGVDFVNGGKVLKVEVKVIFSMFWSYFY